MGKTCDENRRPHCALGKKKKRNNTHDIYKDYSSFEVPIRRNAFTFKQPVTVIRNHPESETKTDLKFGVQEKPQQLFWEKRLQGLIACDSTGKAMECMDLPLNMNGVGPDLSTVNVLQSISAALHLNTVPVTGQSSSRSSIQKNPGVNIDASQPHIQQMLVSEEDIQRQEQRVTDVRCQLQDLFKKGTL